MRSTPRVEVELRRAID